MKKLLASFLLISSMANAGWSDWIPSWNTVKNTASSAWQSVAQSSVYNSASTFVSNHPTATSLAGTAVGLGVAMAVINRGHNGNVKRTVVRVNETPNYGTPETHQRWFDKTATKKPVETETKKSVETATTYNGIEIVRQLQNRDKSSKTEFSSLIQTITTLMADKSDNDSIRGAQSIVEANMKSLGLTFELLNQQLEAKKAATVSSSTSVATPAKQTSLSKKAKALIVGAGGIVATGIGYGLYCYLNNGEQPTTDGTISKSIVAEEQQVEQDTSDMSNPFA
jgi:hypothetical protein